MGLALMFLLALYHMQSAIHSEIIETPYNANALIMEPVEDSGLAAGAGEGELMDGLINEKPEQTELEFRYPISAIGIDYAKNSVVLRFQKNARKQRYKFDPELEAKRKSLQDNFMHWGKRQAEQLPQEPGPGYGYYDTEAVEKRSNVMDRYGRDPKQDFMRFGRSAKDDFMRFGRSAKDDFMRFGRNPKDDFMRFGRNPREDFMRFGRASSDFMRFGRTPTDFMRFGRSRHAEELRSPKQDFMRFGRPDNFMRFGRAATTESNQTKSQTTAKQGNPVDKAMARLFNNKEQSTKSGEQTGGGSGGGGGSGDNSEEQFYGQ